MKKVDIKRVRHFQLISEMFVNDLASLGHFIGFFPTLDNTKVANINQFCCYCFYFRKRII